MPRLLSQVMLTLLIAASLWPNPGLAADVRKLKLGILQTGSQDFVHTVMEQQKFLQKYNLPYERISILNPPALHLMIAEKTVDIGYGGLTAMARARAEGKGTLVIYGIFSPVNALLVPKNSPVKTLADLRGKRVGNFGLLRSMEQARRSALAHHVHRTVPMGARVLINGTWYKGTVTNFFRKTDANPSTISTTVYPSPSDRSLRPARESPLRTDKRLALYTGCKQTYVR